MITTLGTVGPLAAGAAGRASVHAARCRVGRGIRSRRDEAVHASLRAHVGRHRRLVHLRLPGRPRHRRGRARRRPAADERLDARARRGRARGRRRPPRGSLADPPLAGIPPVDRVVTGAVLIGYFFNTILPARAGEAARVVVLKQRAGTPRFEAVGTVGAERVLDVLVLLVLSSRSPRSSPHGLARPLGRDGRRWVRRALHTRRRVRRLRTASGELLLRPLALLPGISRELTETGAANLVGGFSLFRRPASRCRPRC